MNSIEQVVTGLVSAKQQYDKLVEEATVPLKTELSNLLKSLPEVEAIRWTQYTPHFNDGDECVFSVHEPYMITKGLQKQLDEGEIDEWDAREEYSLYWSYDKLKEFSKEEDSYWSGKLDKLVKAAGGEENLKRICAFTGQFGELEDVFKSAFGDHAQVTVTAEGVTVDEYDHD